MGSRARQPSRCSSIITRIYHDGAPVQVPHGVGIGQPRQVQSSSEGPFVTGGSCFYWLHTHTPDGIIHIEGPLERTFSLGDFFAVWGQPLGADQVGPLQAPVTAYLNGTTFNGNPATMPLRAQAEIQLDVGADAPAPQPFIFPPGL